MQSARRTLTQLVVCIGIAAGAAGLFPSQAFAVVITGTMDPTTVAAMVRTVCFSGAHRAYDPATTLAVAGTSTFNIGIEASLYKVPAAFTTAMSSMGGGSLAALPVLPIPRLHIRKGLGPKADLGLSAFFMGSTFRFYGGDLKFALTQPERRAAPEFPVCPFVFISVSRGRLDAFPAVGVRPAFQLRKPLHCSRRTVRSRHGLDRRGREHTRDFGGLSDGNGAGRFWRNRVQHSRNQHDDPDRGRVSFLRHALDGP